ncbi:hypothetical protein NBRC116594_14080 [Shimia sp. NS0008-38b]|uniref:hypothetical protein n=1 Tax=Shimia sp. NS0008-38b TaxID=3127653 RepID=UPI003107CB2E
MTLVCPECEQHGFSIVDSVELGPSASADERTVQRAHCTDCDTRFFCLYLAVRSHKQGRDDDETHLAYVANKDVWTKCADVFETPTRRRASPERIEDARRVWDLAQQSGSMARTITFRRSDQNPVVASPSKTKHMDDTWMRKLYLKLWGGQ